MLGVPVVKDLRFRRFLNSKTENARDVPKPTLPPRVPVQDATRAVLVVLDTFESAVFDMSAWYSVGTVSVQGDTRAFAGLVLDIDVQNRGGIFGGGAFYDRGTLWGDFAAEAVQLPRRWAWTPIGSRPFTRWSS